MTVAAPRQVTAQPMSPARTLWGLAPAQLHDRYWASRGIQVVRRGETTELATGAELYLLTEPATLTVFRPARVAERLVWTDVELMIVRVTDARKRPYLERIETDDESRFLRFRRIYGENTPTARVALTPDERIARLWQGAAAGAEGWRQLRAAARRSERWSMAAAGHVYDSGAAQQVAQFISDLVTTWKRPDAVIDGLRRVGEQIWADRAATVDAQVQPTGPIWIGAGRQLDGGGPIMGPGVIWDDPGAAPVPQDVAWLQLEPSEPPEDIKAPRRGSVARAAKRLFDIGFALAALGLTLPLYPLIALAILVEDGRPIFFTHERETIGGRRFACIKFRSMRKNAEEIKRELAAKNQADGPQFFIEDDPRLTRVGRILRKLQLDELPQFVNVLMGDMSVVGPRPSPFVENQYCPGWREARLSVRPGVTGLWQVKRTRAVGTDFQEWIKYDLEYVERASMWLDIRIIWQTVTMLVRSVMRS